MPDWKRRSATVLIGMPTVTWIFTNHVATTVTLAVLTAAATLELCTHIIPGLMRQLDRGADATPSYMQEALIRRGTHVAVLCSVAMVLASAYSRDAFQLVMAVCIVATCLLHLFQYRGTAAVPTAADALVMVLHVFALLYIAWPVAHVIMLHKLPYGTGLLILEAYCVMNADNGAILLGSAMGRYKFFPEVSPKKTWAGFVGALLGSAVTALIIASLQRTPWLSSGFLPAASLQSYGLLGLVIGLFAILGDLVESVLKRAAGVKDSGSFFPGHGGCLDRMDSSLLVAPLFLHLVVPLFG